MRDKNLGSILEGLRMKRSQANVMEQANIASGGTGRVGIVHYLSDMYEGQKRKGIDKPAMAHVFDVIDYAHLEDVETVGDSALLFKACLAHDVFEDSGEDLQTLKDKMGLNDRDIELLKLLSRNHTNEDGSDYLDGILANDYALVVKLADRLANLHDLVRWIENINGFTRDSKYTAIKYLDETKYLINAIGGLKGAMRRVNPIGKQVKELIDILKKVEKYLEEKYVTEAVLDVDEVGTDSFDIQKEDIYKTYEIVRQMYRNSKELQRAYPDYLERLDGSLNKVEEMIERKGWDAVKASFDKIKFTEENFTKSFQGYMDDKLKEALVKLSPLKEAVPKEGIVQAIADKFKKSVNELIKLISSADKGVLSWLYDAITKIMDTSWEAVEGNLNKKCSSAGGKLIYRPSKYKDKDRAIEKYYKEMRERGKKGDKSVDFLDLTDIMGFRGQFHSIADVVDFAIQIIETKDDYVFKLNNYVGSGTAYQGVNINSNYKGIFNYEIQAVFDEIQVATDLNHDIFYKKMIAVSMEEKKTVAMLVQICLGLMFSEMFD